MAISDQMARTTVRVECFGNDMQSVGSSFYYRVALEGENWIPILITNRHVVSGFNSSRLTFSVAPDLRNATPQDAVSVTLPNLQDHVVYHPNADIDLAAIFIGPAAFAVGPRHGAIQAVNILEHDLIDDETEATMRFVEDVLVVGYPQGIWDTHRNLPIFRSGITASPAMIDYQGEPKFLIDCSIYPGSSGSPVFLYNSGVVLDAKNNSAGFGERFKLLGVVSQVLIYNANGTIVESAVPTNLGNLTNTGIPNNLGVVVKAREIRPLVAEVSNQYQRLVDLQR